MIRLSPLMLAMLAAGWAAPPIPGPREEVSELARDLSEGKDIRKKVAALRKKYEDLYDLAGVFKNRAKDGIGVGPRGKSDGIEPKLVDLGRRPMSREKLKAERDEIVRMGHVLAAMADIFDAYTPEKGVGFAGTLGPKEWKTQTSLLRSGGRDLIRAALNEDPLAVRDAARVINISCNNCHTEGRER